MLKVMVMCSCVHVFHIYQDQSNAVVFMEHRTLKYFCRRTQPQLLDLEAAAVHTARLLWLYLPLHWLVQPVQHTKSSQQILKIGGVLLIS